MSIGDAPARRAKPVPAPLRRATAVLACPHCRGRLRPHGRSLVCRRGHRFDVACQGSVRLDVGRARVVHEGDDGEMIEARRVVFEAGAFRVVTEALCDAIGHVGRPWWLLDVGVGTGHHSEAILEHSADAHGVAIDVSRHALAAAARRHPRLAAVGADVWAGLPIRDTAIDVVLVAFAPRNVAEMRRVLRADGRILVLTPAADHLHELLEHASVSIEADKRERLDRDFGQHFELARRIPITNRVEIASDVAAALWRMGPWARHALNPQPLETVTIAVELSVYRPR